MSTATDGDTSTVVIKSDPDGADISIDSKFVGTTPSTFQIKPGEHVISIEKTGYKGWLKTMTVSAGSSVNLSPNLEKVQ